MRRGSWVTEDSGKPRREARCSLGPGMALPAGPSPFRRVSSSGEGHRAGQGPPGLNPPGQVVGPAALRTLLCSSGLLQRVCPRQASQGIRRLTPPCAWPYGHTQMCHQPAPFPARPLGGPGHVALLGLLGSETLPGEAGGFPNTDTLLLPPVAPAMSWLTTATANKHFLCYCVFPPL